MLLHGSGSTEPLQTFRVRLGHSDCVMDLAWGVAGPSFRFTGKALCKLTRISAVHSKGCSDWDALLRQTEHAKLMTHRFSIQLDNDASLT